MRAECYEVAAANFQRGDRFATIGCRPPTGGPGLARVVAGKGEPMAITEDRPARVRTFDSTSPATGEVVGSFPLEGPEQVAAAVARAREAQRGWAGLGFDGRRRALLAYKATLVRRTDELVDLVHRENGKPSADALIEVVLIVEHLDWAARNAARVLGRRRVRSTMLLANHAASVEYQPLGVVGVIGPWKQPLLQGYRSRPAVRDHRDGGIAAAGRHGRFGDVLPVAPPIAVHHPRRDEASTASSLGIALP
jgi:aldehyde dehydrogenase family protein